MADYLLNMDNENLLNTSLIFLANHPNDSETLNTLFQFIIKTDISVEDVPNIISNQANKKVLDIILNNLGILFWENEHYEYVLPLLNESLKLNSKNSDALFNMGYVLYKFQENKLAIKYLETIDLKSKEVLDLIHEINKKMIPPFFNEYKVEELNVTGIDKAICVRMNTTDPIVFQQIFHHREYELPKLSFIPKLIIDGGANVGFASIYFANIYPGAQIIAVEPEESNFEVLKYNTSPYEQIEIIKSGLWHKNTFLKVKDIGLGKWGSVVEETDSCDKESFRAITIQSILEGSDMDEIDILKLDIEGAEKELFLFGYENWLDKVKVIIIELHDRMKRGCSNSFFRAISNYNFVSLVKGENIILIKEEYFY